MGRPRKNPIVGTEEPAPECPAGLVEVVLGDESLFIHPDAVADHQRLGWKRAE